MTNQVIHGDCMDVMRGMEDNSIDTIITDPPYALTNRTPDVKRCLNCSRVLGGRDGNPESCPKCGGELSRQRSAQKRGFMGKAWDSGIPGVSFWAEMLRVAKPGATLLAFGGTRTHHRLMVAIEDAGWEIRDCLMWLYGSGFPKSHAIGKSIDRAAGKERETIGRYVRPDGSKPRNNRKTPKFKNVYIDSESGLDANDSFITTPATEAAATWEGWGTGLKPAYENVIVAQKTNPTLSIDTLFDIIIVTNLQILCEVLLCQARYQSNVSNVGSHLRHLDQKLNEVAENIALENVLVYPKERELVEFVNSVENHLNCLRVKLSEVMESTALEDVRASGKRDADGGIQGLKEKVTPTGKAADLQEVMGMLLSMLEAENTDLNTMLLWKNTLGEVLAQMSKFTILMKFEMITDLKTLNWLLFRSISENIILQSETLTDGQLSPVSIAASLLNGAKMKLNVILEHFAQESVTEENHTPYQGAIDNKQIIPAYEPIIMAQKPIDGTYANNAQVHGVAGLNIDGGRIALNDYDKEEYIPNRLGYKDGINYQNPQGNSTFNASQESAQILKPSGRWPANVLLSHAEGCVRRGEKRVRGHSGYPKGPGGNSEVYRYSASGHSEDFRETAKAGHADPNGLETVADWECVEGCPIRILDEQAGVRKSGAKKLIEKKGGQTGAINNGAGFNTNEYRVHNKNTVLESSSGSASRFFYTAKAPNREKWFYCQLCQAAYPNKERDDHGHDIDQGQRKHIIAHPTVKPESILNYLCKLTKTPTGGIVLDPFAGSGTTALACLEAGRDFILIEKESDYYEIAKARVAAAMKEPRQAELW